MRASLPPFSVMQAAPRARAGEPHGLPGCAAADVGDHVDRRVPGERGAGDGIPLDELEHAVGKASGDEVGEPAPRCGAALRRLVDDGVARDERGRDEAGGGGVGVVPRGDDPDDASWLGAHEVHGARSAGERPPAHQAGDGRLVEEVGRHQRRGAGLGVQPARRRAQEVRELVRGRPDGTRRLSQVRGPLGRCRTPPSGCGGPGAADSAVNRGLDRVVGASGLEVSRGIVVWVMPVCARCRTAPNRRGAEAAHLGGVRSASPGSGSSCEYSESTRSSTTPRPRSSSTAGSSGQPRRSASRGASTGSGRCRSRPGSCRSRRCGGASTRRASAPQDLDAVAYSFDPALAKPAEDMGLEDPWDALRRMYAEARTGLPRDGAARPGPRAGPLRPPPRGPRRLGRTRRADRGGGPTLQRARARRSR